MGICMLVAKKKRTKILIEDYSHLRCAGLQGRKPRKKRKTVHEGKKGKKQSTKSRDIIIMCCKG